MIKCSECGKENPKNFRFCGFCGNKLEEPKIYCPKCKIKHKEIYSFCSECGTKLVTKTECKLKIKEPKNKTKHKHYGKLTDQTTCELCGKQFLPKRSGSKYCPDCKKKYDATELRVMLKIKNGEVTEELAKKIIDLKKQGYTNIKIGKKLKVQAPYIPYIISQFGFETKIQSANRKPIKCVLCGESFTPKGSGSKYCPDCKLKYDSTELVVLTKIKNGEITEELAKKVIDLKKQDYSNIEIDFKLKKVHESYVPYIISYFTPKTEAHTTDKKLIECYLCGEPFTPKSSSSRYCSNCKKKYKPEELIVRSKIKNGEITEKLAKKVITLKKQGYTNQEIDMKLKISENYIPHIISYFDNKTDSTPKIKQTIERKTNKNLNSEDILRRLYFLDIYELSKISNHHGFPDWGDKSSRIHYLLNNLSLEILDQNIDAVKKGTSLIKYIERPKPEQHNPLLDFDFNITELEEMRLLPMSNNIFGTEARVKHFLNIELKKELKGRYPFVNRKIKEIGKTLVLFQYSNTIIGYGLLIDSNDKFNHWNNHPYEGNYIFDIDTITVLKKPISKDKFKIVNPKFNSFNQSTQRVLPAYWERILGLLQIHCE